MNWLIHFNEGIHLPESMAGIEQAMRSMEDMAQANVELVQGGAGIGDLIMSILIVGIFAGFCEELLFRGAFVRLLVSMKLNIHAAIWIVAFVFSALHFQFYGFFPRLLLGALFCACSYGDLQVMLVREPCVGVGSFIVSVMMQPLQRLKARIVRNASP